MFKINVVEDEKNLAGLLETYLKKEGYECKIFNTGEEAMAHKADDVHLEMTEEEQSLQRLIGDFYDEMIKSISDCNSDLEVMKVFKVKSEIQSDLMSYLERNGISSRMTKTVVEDLF
ncbi:MAG: hypothetical protein II508_07520, partial [Acholeplasmatales bacterium]|nr:hypothetical protein [Acholeplasmatales bacterium]